MRQITKAELKEMSFREILELIYQYNTEYDFIFKYNANTDTLVIGKTNNVTIHSFSEKYKKPWVIYPELFAHITQEVF